MRDMEIAGFRAVPPRPAPPPPADKPVDDQITEMCIAVMLGTVPGTATPASGTTSIPEAMRHS